MADQKISKRDELRLSESWRKRIGVALRDARGQAGLTKPKLAEKAGLDWTTISQIENGASAPDLATMEAISDALGVSLDVATGRMSQERRDSARRFLEEPMPPAASDAARSRSDPSLQEEWEAFRADLRPALLKLADVLEQGSAEEQALRRALAGKEPPSSGRQTGR